jgi:hypothetical protein
VEISAPSVVATVPVKISQQLTIPETTATATNVAISVPEATPTSSVTSLPTVTTLVSAALTPNLFVSAPPALPVKIFKCDHCEESFQTSRGLGIHIGRIHKPQFRPTKDVYYHPKDSCPLHTPTPPNCKKCKLKTTWTASRVKSDKSWLHEFSCQPCSDRTTLSTRVTVTTPPVY